MSNTVIDQLSNILYRVTCKWTASYQPGADNDWTRNVAYCGYDKREAFRIYKLNETQDYFRGHGAGVRQTEIEALDINEAEEFK